MQRLTTYRMKKDFQTLSILILGGGSGGDGKIKQTFKYIVFVVQNEFLLITYRKTAYHFDL